jgi:NAD(P)-dependent dehydrogenase (short-subunit alcohol dehydrogenase family)
VKRRSHYGQSVELHGKVTIVTGAANGIGRALARRFHAGGARGVVVADLDGTGAERVAAELDAIRPGSAVGVVADVSTAAGNEALIDDAERRFGEIDLFFANAGVGIGTDLETPDDVWRTAFAVNVEAHYYAARRLLPGWLARREGYFCSTASAAGLLTQIGSAPYSVTKHAAVAFAEWLSVTYGDRGVRVSCLCPMGVNTSMLSSAEPGGVVGVSSDVVRAAGAVLEPEAVADIVVEAISDERFLILPHPEVLTFFQRKASDYDRWLAGMRRLQSRVQG